MSFAQFAQTASSALLTAAAATPLSVDGVTWAQLIQIGLTGLLIPAVWKAGRAMIDVRDSFRDMQRDLKSVKSLMGKEQPPEGVLGDISHIKRELRRHRDWLIEANIVHPADRT